MSGFVAAALVGIQAESEDEAWDRATHDADLPWEVAACVPQVTAHKAVEAIVEAAHTPATKARLFANRPIFGKASLVALPLMAYGYVTDTSALGTLVAACSALTGF